MPMGSDGDWPSVSVIIPMLNELGFIEACIDGIDVQTYPADLIEILVVDGGSTDGSRELVGRLAAADPRIRLLDNPRVLAAAAANVGIAEATTDVLCFLSAHGVAEPDYIELSVRALVETGAVGVGGRYCHEGLDPKSTAIGMAMASPFGMASPHRVATERMSVDTISHPVFLRQPLVDVGGYDETLLRNEDYELNFRLREAGGDLVFTPEISTVYRPRGSILALAKQFFAYGRGKTSVLAKHPSAFQLRHVCHQRPFFLLRRLDPCCRRTERPRRSHCGISCLRARSRCRNTSISSVASCGRNRNLRCRAPDHPRDLGRRGLGRAARTLGTSGHGRPCMTRGPDVGLDSSPALVASCRCSALRGSFSRRRQCRSWNSGCWQVDSHSSCSSAPLATSV